MYFNVDSACGMNRIDIAYYDGTYNSITVTIVVVYIYSLSLLNAIAYYRVLFGSRINGSGLLMHKAKYPDKSYSLSLGSVATL